jgi:hypothetical protein
MENKGRVYRMTIRKSGRSSSEQIVYGLEWADREPQALEGENRGGYEQAKGIQGLAEIILEKQVERIDNSIRGFPDFRIEYDKQGSPFELSLYSTLSEEEMISLREALHQIGG